MIGTSATRRATALSRHLASRPSMGAALAAGVRASGTAAAAGVPSPFRPNKSVNVLDSSIAYVDTGASGSDAAAAGGRTVVFLHGNPTNSYLWRDVVGVVGASGAHRCLAPDLVGFGRSGASGDGSYRFAAHYKYLEAWFSALGLGRGGDADKVLLVIHDWGSALGFTWAREHASRVAGIVHMESLVQPVASWAGFPEAAAATFQKMRTPGVGEKMVLEKNFFVERLLLGDRLTQDSRPWTAEEKAVYRERFKDSEESRLPTLQWPREIPVEGEPADVHKVLQANRDFHSADEGIPKLFVDAKPGFFSKDIRKATEGWKNHSVVGPVVGLHFIQEDSGKEIGQHVLDFIKDKRL